MNNRKRDKQKRQRLSLQNRDLVRNQLNLVIDKIKEEEKEVTKEEDPLKFFSQQLKKQEKEKERQKYLQSIKEEDDPLKFFEQNKETKEEAEQDPLKYVKENEQIIEEVSNEPKILGNLALHDEKKLAEAIINNDIPEEIIINKQEDKNKNIEDKEKKMKKRMNTALRLTSHKGLERRLNDKLLQRVKNSNKAVTGGDSTKNVSNTTGSGNSNTLLGADEQVNSATNTQTTKQTKQVDLKNFMAKK